MSHAAAARCNRYERAAQAVEDLLASHYPDMVKDADTVPYEAVRLLREAAVAKKDRITGPDGKTVGYFDYRGNARDLMTRAECCQECAERGVLHAVEVVATHRSTATAHPVRYLLCASCMPDGPGWKIDRCLLCDGEGHPHGGPECPICGS